MSLTPQMGQNYFINNFHKNHLLCLDNYGKVDLARMAVPKLVCKVPYAP